MDTRRDVSRAGESWSGSDVLDYMDRVIRFEQELTLDEPRYQIGDSGTSFITSSTTATDIDNEQVIFFGDIQIWKLRRYLIVELAKQCFRFIIEDRGHLPIMGAMMQEIRLQRACLERGVFETYRKVTGSLPEETNSYELYIKLRMLETTPRELAETVIWNLFWELEVVPSYYAPEKSWVYPYAKNHLKHLHEEIRSQHTDKVKEVMDS